MTKKYIAFTDNVLPVSGYESADEGKIAKVVNDSGSYKLKVVDGGGIAAHAASHASGGSDAITIAESQVTDLTTDLAAKQANITKSTTAGVPEAIVTTDTDGSVAKRAICTDLTPSTVTSATTDLATAGAVKAFAAQTDSTSTVTYKIGCDATGPYMDY